MSSDINALEFMRGQQACKDGLEWKESWSESFQRGYAAQYDAQMLDEEMGNE
jgi:hypothetical protein